VIPVAFFGGGFWPTALALVLGTALGSLTHGVLSSWGRSTGFQRAVFPYLAVVFALATVVILSKTHFGAGFDPHFSPGGGSSAAFVLAFFISYGYAVGWNPYASDYSRYLPRTVDRRCVGLSAFTYWITPFLAVVLLDYWLRRGDYDEREFFEGRRLRWRAPLAMAIGMAASVPFWDQGHPIPLGYFPKHYPQIGDLSFFVGFTVAGLVYLALNTNAVRKAISPSLR
jgi:purine-cytosine permease-like protein